MDMKDVYKKQITDLIHKVEEYSRKEKTPARF